MHVLFFITDMIVICGSIIGYHRSLLCTDFILVLRGTYGESAGLARECSGLSRSQSVCVHYCTCLRFLTDIFRFRCKDWSHCWPKPAANT
mgnify:CR=1 FL=1